jgi:heat shock protein HslJ
MARYDYGYKMNMAAKLISFILPALFITSFSQAQVSVDSAGAIPTGYKSLNGIWYLQPVLESDTSSGQIPEINFDVKTGRFAGNTGCNRMSGSFLATDTSLHFGNNMITTRMACIGYNESAFIKNLLRIDSYKIENGVLILTVNNEEVSRWARKKPVPKKTGKA